MSTLPTTTVCYAPRIAALQREVQAILDRLPSEGGSSQAMRRTASQVQPLYAALWAMHAEVNV
jgi:hypothetical protein